MNYYRNMKESKKTAIVKVERDLERQSFNIEKAIDAFLEAQDIREISKLVYRKGVEKFLHWMASNNITQPNRNSILRFKTFLIESDLSANSVNSYLVSVKRYFSYLQGEGLYADIAANVKGPTPPKGFLRESPTEEQVKDLLAGIDTSLIQGKRNFAMINLMARVGLRTCEVVRANLEDIKQSSGEALLWVQGKGKDGKDDFNVLTAKSLKPIHVYLKARGKVEPTDPLFCSHSDRSNGQRLNTGTIRKISKDAFRSIGIDSKKLSAHSFRHFAATASIKAGAEPLQTMAMMRHSSLTTTMRYVHNIQRIEKAAERFVDF